ncbi:MULTISPECIES: Zn-dependent hydrolase [Cupriavidus]|nr:MULTISPECIES: Zn-dependent hydrolase [Cupriavidus]
MMERLPEIDGARLLRSLDELAQVGAIEGGGVCRLALSDADRAGRDWTVARMRALDMAVSIDAIGNITGIYAGSDSGTDSGTNGRTGATPAPVMTGSHIDTVRTGGRYDGNYGVLAGLEVVAALRQAGVRTRRPLAVTVFTNEEGARFQPDMMGSLVYVGGLPLAEALATRGIDGATVGEELARIGYQGTAAVGAPRVDSFVELHIEQGPVLEQQGLRLGVVEGVQGISWNEYTIEGVSNHAGTTPMALRRDAGHAAARVATFVHDLALRYGGRQIGTVGAMQFAPNLINVIPHRAVFTVDLRNTDNAALRAAEEEVQAFVAQCCEEAGLAWSRRALARFAPVAFDCALVDEVARHAQALGLPAMRLPSGAGHDAQMLARACPAAMIFVPSVGGLSHNVREFTRPEDLVDGARVLMRVLLARADRPLGAP